MVSPEYYQFMRGLSRHELYCTVLAASEDQLEKQRDMEYVCRFLVHTYVDYDRRLDVEDFIDESIVDLAGTGETERAGRRFRRTFDLLFEAHGADALRRFDRGNARGRVLLAAYECIAIGVGEKPSPNSQFG